MASHDPELTGAVFRVLADEIADRLAERLTHLVSTAKPPETTPWLTTEEAIEYSRLPDGTFRKLASSGKIPSHGGRSKLFYRPEIDQALLEYSGMAEENRRLRQVR